MIYLTCLIIASSIILFDLISKYLVVLYSVDFVVIPYLLKFELTYNTGAAFSFLGEKDWARTFFIILTSIVCLLIVAVFVFLFVKKKKISKWLAVASSMIFAGAVGNLIDRVFLGVVRDFIFVFYKTRIFPAIFNVADIFLVIGVIMIFIYLLFLDKDAIFRKKKNAK